MSENSCMIVIVFLYSAISFLFFQEYLDEVQLEVDVAVAQYAEDYDVQQLLNLAQELVDNDVGFVGCQKCMHPLMREHLEQQVSCNSDQCAFAHAHAHTHMHTRTRTLAQIDM